MFRWYRAFFDAHTNASIQHPAAAADGSPATAAASTRGAPWSHPTASATGSATDVRLSGSASSRRHASCTATATNPDWSTDASTKTTIELIGTPLSWRNTTELVEQHRDDQILLGNTIELADVCRWHLGLTSCYGSQVWWYHGCNTIALLDLCFNFKSTELIISQTLLPTRLIFRKACTYFISYSQSSNMPDIIDTIGLATKMEIYYWLAYT